MITINQNIVRESSRRRLKIAYCLDSFNIGGTELNAVRTAEALDSKRFEIMVFHLAANGPLRSRYEDLGLSMTHIEIPNLYSVKTIRQAIRLSGLLRQADVDIVHSHDIYCNIFVVPWARMLTNCSVIAGRRWGRMASSPKLQKINRFACKFGHRVLGNSKTVAKILVETDKVPAKKVFYVPNFVEEKAFTKAPQEARHLRRQMWGIPENALVVGIVARLSPVKNHPLLLRALAVVGPEFHLVVVGDGPCRDELEILANQFDIASRVHFVGEVVQDENLHQYFDVSVLCSFSEGFPNTLIEAMAAARSVVATPVGGVVDAVEDGVNGILVSTDDPSELATALIKLKEDPSLRNRFGEAGSVVARKVFHEEAVIPKLSEFYESLASRRLPALVGSDYE